MYLCYEITFKTHLQDPEILEINIMNAKSHNNNNNSLKHLFIGFV